MDVAPVMLGGAEYRVLLPEGVDVYVNKVAGGYLVSVSGDARVYGPCARCLAEVALDVHAEEEEFAPTAGGEWEESDTSPFIEGVVVDVEGFVREAIVLALPEQVLCSEACKGLCVRCGRDLNQGACDCGSLEIS